MNLIGSILDEKYLVERELGRGGMGAVYIAAHIGTERYVAVKVIAPEFMRRPEFVERFRREARAAGRLRHPNVVDVTDFGVAKVDGGHLAYLVMELLDGCTLGEILEEEKRLPLSWTLDILEQTCAAVDAAHRQGIIHRDLKPDNIWLEPNARGGYTVKVLDFGIAKLEESTPDNDDFQISDFQIANLESQISNSDDNRQTLALPVNAAEDATLELSANSHENETAILPQNFFSSQTDNRNSTANEPESARETSALTRVGAVLGTPLYMSPEQCRGEKLDSRADVYSLGVIAYQLLSGETPFAGKYTDVLEAHKSLPAPQLDNKKVGRKVKNIIAQTLSKAADERPHSAAAFASRLRANSDGIGALFQRALVIFTEHLPMFLWLALLLQLPSFLLTMARIVCSFLSYGNVISADALKFIYVFSSFVTFFTAIFFGSILLGVTTWITVQLLAVPLRPVKLKSAFLAVRKRWRPFFGTVLITSVLAVVGYFLCVLPGIVASICFFLVTPVVLMENLRGRAAIKRSIQLVRRALPTAFAALLLSFVAPMLLSGILAVFVGALVKTSDSFQFKSDKTGVHIQLDDGTESSESSAPPAEIKVAATTEPTDGQAESPKPKQTQAERRQTQLRQGVFELLFNLLWTPFLIFLSAITSIITALLYLKTRQAGGESMTELLAQFAETDRTDKNWRRRLNHKFTSSARGGRSSNNDNAA